jgi:hypothetical protein
MDRPKSTSHKMFYPKIVVCTVWGPNIETFSVSIARCDCASNFPNHLEYCLLSSLGPRKLACRPRDLKAWPIIEIPVVRRE